MDNWHSNCAVLIPAAGFSSRMGSFKPLLPFDGESALLRIARIWQECDVRQITAVSGYKAEDLEAEAARANIPCIRNPRPEDGMFSSIRLGLGYLYRYCDVEWFALHPVDIPLVQASTILALLVRAHDLKGGVLYPSHMHRRGHPPLLHRSLVPHILSWNGDMGLRGALRDSPASYLDTDDRGVLTDMDHPQDYARALHILHPECPSP